MLLATADAAAGRDVRASRLLLLLNVLDRNPQAKARLARTTRSVIAELDALELYCETGLPREAAFWSEGFDDDDVDHWERILWTSLYGFTAIRHADRFRRGADPELTLDIMLKAFTDELERSVASPTVGRRVDGTTALASARRRRAGARP